MLYKALFKNHLPSSHLLCYSDDVFYYKLVGGLISKLDASL